MTDKEQFAKPPRWLIPGIIAALLIWALVIAVGAIRSADSNTTSDYLKPILIAGTVATFVGVWVQMLRTRSQGKTKK